jgi:RNA polymerase sigma factor (sigma-70 family)
VPDVSPDPLHGPLPDALLSTAKPSPSDALADELLAIRCQLGEPEALDALIARWHEPLRRYLLRTLGARPEAEDVVQDTWLRVVRALPRLEDPARLRAWLFGIARRALMDQLRRDYGRANDVALELAEADAGMISDDAQWQLERDESIALLADSLEALPLVEREVLVLFYLQELTLDQLALVLEVPVGTVKSRLFRARRRLRAHLLTKGVEP